MRFKKMVAAVLATLMAFSPCVSAAGDFDSWWIGFKEKSVAALNDAQIWCADHEDEAAAAWDRTKAWCDDHREAIATVAAVTAVVVAEVIAKRNSVNSAPGTQGPYVNIPDPVSVGPGKEFTQAQKARILEENMLRNHGELRSDQSGKPLSFPGRYTSGHTPPMNEAQVDHVYPRSLGGENSFGNAQVLSRDENLLKSDSVK